MKFPGRFIPASVLARGELAPPAGADHAIGEGQAQKNRPDDNHQGRRTVRCDALKHKSVTTRLMTSSRQLAPLPAVRKTWKRSSGCWMSWTGF